MYTAGVPNSQRRSLNEKHQYITNWTSNCVVYNNVVRIVHKDPPRVPRDKMFFALATTAERMMDPNAITQISWLPNSGVHLHLTVPWEQKQEQIAQVKSFLSRQGLASYHIAQTPEGVSYGDGWSCGLPKMVEISRNNKYEIDYYIQLDDDTMIPSLDNFRRVLDIHNPEEEVYIGAPSEVIDQARDSRGGQCSEMSNGRS